jgi:SAM-dependent methyltransferase
MNFALERDDRDIVEAPRESGAFRYRDSRWRNLWAQEADGAQAEEREQLWMRSTVYADILDMISYFAPGERVLDVGCGKGELLRFLAEHGVEGAGLEPEIAEPCVDPHLVHELSLEAFAGRFGQAMAGHFGTVTLVNVLEHVKTPARTLAMARPFARMGGLLCVRARNASAPPSVCVPRQRLDVEAICELMENEGFEVVHAQCDFPSSLVRIIAGADLDSGAACELGKMSLELALCERERRRLASALAVAGLGDHSLVFGRRTR